MAGPPHCVLRPALAALRVHEVMNKFILLVLMSLSTNVFSQGTIRFSELATSSLEEKHFKELIITELLKDDLEPSEFYVTRIIDTAEIIKLELEHKDDRSSKNQNNIGNLSGKSQVCEYSKKHKELKSCLYFQ